MKLPTDYVVFDLETTGLSPAYAEIIEIGALKVSERIVTGAFHTYVKNTFPIPEKITRLTGISDSDTYNAPAVNVALNSFRNFIGSSTLVAHNARFDCSFIGTASAFCGIRSLVFSVRLALRVFSTLENGIVSVTAESS